MKMNPKFTIETLRGLIAVCRDSEQGLRLCAGYTASPQLRGVFTVLAWRCLAAIPELEGAVCELGADPAQGAVGPRGLTRERGKQWTALACSEDGAILEECERGASRLLEVYRNALDEHLPERVRGIVLRQFERLMLSHEQIRDVCHQPIPDTLAMGPRGAQAGQ